MNVGQVRRILEQYEDDVEVQVLLDDFDAIRGEGIFSAEISTHDADGVIVNLGARTGADTAGQDRDAQYERALPVYEPVSK